MIELVKELKVELVEVKGKHYFRLLFDDNMNIYVHPSLVSRNKREQDVVNFPRSLKIEQTFYKNYFLMQPDDGYVEVLVSDKPLEIRLDYEDPIGGYWYEFKLNDKYYYFVDGGYNGFTFRCEGKLYVITTDGKIKEVIQYTPPEEFEVNLKTLAYL